MNNTGFTQLYRLIIKTIFTRVAQKTNTGRVIFTFSATDTKSNNEQQYE